MSYLLLTAGIVLAIYLISFKLKPWLDSFKVRIDPSTYVTPASADTLADKANRKSYLYDAMQSISTHARKVYKNCIGVKLEPHHVEQFLVFKRDYNVMHYKPTELEDADTWRKNVGRINVPIALQQLRDRLATTLTPEQDKQLAEHQKQALAAILSAGYIQIRGWKAIGTEGIHEPTQAPQQS